MVQAKKRDFKFPRCSLGILLMLMLRPCFAQTFKLGRITQSHGEISRLNLKSHRLFTEVKVGSHFFSGSSYLTRDNAFLTIALHEGNWLRLSPNSKIATEFNPESNLLTLNLITGSIKVLYSVKSAQAKGKIVIKGPGVQFESVDGKFAATRNNITDMTSVFVEKGTVLAEQEFRNQSKSNQLVHQGEFITLRDQADNMADPEKMTKKELKFLHPSNYLKTVKPNSGI